MTSIAFRVQIKRRVKLVTGAERRRHEITSTSLYCKMLESMDGTKFAHSAKKRVYQRGIYKYARAMVAGKKATRNLCQTRFIATKRKRNAQQCCASIVQKDASTSKKLSMHETV